MDYKAEIEKYIITKIDEYKLVLNNKEMKKFNRYFFILKNVIESASFLVNSYDLTGEQKKETVEYIAKNFLIGISDNIDIPYIPKFIERIIFRFFINEVLSEIIEYIYKNVVKVQLQILHI